jgi:hypothetical protein
MKQVYCRKKKKKKKKKIKKNKLNLFRLLFLSLKIISLVWP